MGYKEKILAEFKKQTHNDGYNLEPSHCEILEQILASLPSEAEIAGKLYKKWQQTVVYSLDIKEGQLFDVWLSKEADE